MVIKMSMLEIAAVLLGIYWVYLVFRLSYDTMEWDGPS